MAQISYNNLGYRVALAGGFQVRYGDNTYGTGLYSGTTPPKSGTSGTTVRDGLGAPNGAIYIYESSAANIAYINEHTQASPYWTPLNFYQRGLNAYYTDFRDGAGKAHADTAATATLVGSGIRVHGQGIAETDSGLVVTNTATDGRGATATLTTTDEDAHTAVLSVATGTTPMFQADQNGTYVVDANITCASALTNKAVFVGFCGSAADALDPIMTYSGTTISFAATIGDDVAGLAFSSEMTDADRWFAPHDKGNANASIATTATGVDTGVDVTAAGTYQRLRVECDPDGAVRMFIAKAQVASFAAATLDVDEEMQPMIFVESSTTAVQAVILRHFGAWGVRP